MGDITVREVPLSIPPELVFNMALRNHQRIVGKLLEQPGLLAQRIESIISFLQSTSDSQEREDVIEVILANMHLISSYLSASPVLHSVVTSSSSSSSSTPSSRSLSSRFSSRSSSCSSISSTSSLDTVEPPIQFIIELGNTIMTTTGRVARSGIVKLRLLSLLTTLVQASSLRILHSIVTHRINATILSLFSLHPWSSMIHIALTEYVLSILQLNSKALLFDIMRNAKLPFLIVQGLMAENRQFHGYAGHFLHIAVTIQQRLETASSTESMFASTSIDKHDMTRTDWDSFYSQLLTM